MKQRKKGGAMKIAATARGMVQKRHRLTGLDTTVGGAAVGSPVYLSATAGGISINAAPAGADDDVQVVGRVRTLNAVTGTVDIDLTSSDVDRVGGRGIRAGALSADALGRALMVANFFDAATVLDKFAADSWANAALLQIIADGAFVANAATRALFADNFLSAAKLDENDAFAWTGAHTFGSAQNLTPVNAGAAGHTFLATDLMVFGTAGAGNQTYALPPATGSGRRIHVKNIAGAAGVIRLDGDAAETIDGAATFDLAAGQAATIVDNAAGTWIVV